MSDNIPFDIQTEILQKLPVKSLVRFQCVSKQWKSLIDSPEFIKNHYRINHDIHDQHRLFVLREPDCDNKYRYTYKYISIIDNDVYPNQTSSLSLTVLPLLRSLNYIHNDVITCVNGLICFRGYVDSCETDVAVFWNPSVGKFVAIKTPDGLTTDDFIGFGLCPDTFDPKLVRIKIIYDTRRWEVDVFTLSSRLWKRVFTEHNPVYDSCWLKSDHVCIKGCIYWQAYEYSSSGKRVNVIVSFDLTSEMFGKVCLLDRLVPKRNWRVVEVNQSLGVLEYDSDGGCGVWMVEFVTKSFTKMFTVKVPGKYLSKYGVLGFRKNGEVIIKVKDDNKTRLAAYEPSSERVKGIDIRGGINEHGYFGKYCTLIKVFSYVESLLLVDQTSSIIP